LPLRYVFAFGLTVASSLNYFLLKRYDQMNRETDGNAISITECLLRNTRLNHICLTLMFCLNVSALHYSLEMTWQMLLLAWFSVFQSVILFI